MLRIDLRQLQQGPAETTGALAPDDPALEGLDLALMGPVEVTGRLQATEGDNYLWRGHVHAVVAGECRRCLEPVEQVVDGDVDVLFSSDPELLDDPGVYELAADAATLDVAVAVREEVALLASAFPLCRPDCKGLCPTCGADLNAGPCGCAAGSTN
jgi:uncharacterized protein